MPDKKIPILVETFESFALFSKKSWRANIIAIIFIALIGVLSLSLFYGFKKINAIETNSQIAIDTSARVEDKVDTANPSPQEMQKLLASTNRQNVLIDGVLEKDLISVAGERAYLIRFHDGSVDINGTHFMYMTTTNETTSQNVDNVMASFKDIPTTMIPSWWIEDLLDGKCVSRDPDEMSTEPIRSKLLSMGIKRMKVCPVTDLETGNLMAVVGMSWVTRIPSGDECTRSDNAMRTANAKLSGILTIDKK